MPNCDHHHFDSSHGTATTRAARRDNDIRKHWPPLRPTPPSLHPFVRRFEKSPINGLSSLPQQGSCSHLAPRARDPHLRWTPLPPSGITSIAGPAGITTQHRANGELVATHGRFPYTTNVTFPNSILMTREWLQRILPSATVTFDGTSC